MASIQALAGSELFGFREKNELLASRTVFTCIQKQVLKEMEGMLSFY